MLKEELRLETFSVDVGKVLLARNQVDMLCFIVHECDDDNHQFKNSSYSLKCLLKFQNIHSIHTFVSTEFILS